MYRKHKSILQTIQVQCDDLDGCRRTRKKGLVAWVGRDCPCYLLATRVKHRIYKEMKMNISLARWEVNICNSQPSLPLPLSRPRSAIPKLKEIINFPSCDSMNRDDGLEPRTDPAALVRRVLPEIEFSGIELSGIELNGCYSGGILDPVTDPRERYREGDIYVIPIFERAIDHPVVLDASAGITWSWESLPSVPQTQIISTTGYSNIIHGGEHQSCRVGPILIDCGSPSTKIDHSATREL